MRAVLYIFEAMSSLKVNFHKSELVSVNVNGSWLLEVAAILNCKVTTLPILYLGLPVDGVRILGKFLGLNESPSVWIRRLEVWGIRRMREFNLVLLDMWVRDAPLCDRFSRLYDLSENLSQPP
ncbi:hypothetical protein MTR_4g021850 [Medicago truncatula]|uniref:Uncharacterized protein n=1 Tax=Medicago truncatula TaxID=3880 RepID=A0A072UT53_MEDTR|nr:hypothetical protein MTR_4g021850 [Medicago truncatula]